MADNVENIPRRYKVEELIQRVQQQEFPPGKETPNRLLSLWNATRNAWTPLSEKYPDIKYTLPAEAQKIFERDATEFETRMVRYRVAIDEQITSGQGDTIQGRNALLESVINGGFLLNPIVDGKRKDGAHLPDFATPFSISNQYDALAGFDEESRKRFWGEIREDVLDVPHEVAERATRLVTHVVKGIASGAAAGLGLPLTIAGLVLGGMYLWKKAS